MQTAGVHSFSVRSPGRINLIGEHTDYNEGFVLPAAINRFVTIHVNRRRDSMLALHSPQFQEGFERRIEEIRPEPGHWSNYITGVVDQLIDRGHIIGGFNLTISSDIPYGAGLSSSAAICCGTVYALNALFELKIRREEMVLIAQGAEHEFAGVRCGIMDQYASLFGKMDNVIRLDCRSRSHTYVPIDLTGYQIVLFNSNVKHNLASSAYNERRAECEMGVQIIKQFIPEVESLRDVSYDMLAHIEDPTVKRRCAYVVRENERLLAGCSDLSKGDIESFGVKMFETHLGLRDEYEVSCSELDWLVNEAAKQKAVIGARMMGGGFGGCTINIIKTTKVDSIKDGLTKAYKKTFGRELETYIVSIADGTAPVPVFKT